ncbi:carboxylesterase family protein [Nocardia sp. CDC159]|uniref:Carboxylic ester hydrolase n=1 Tax=Nocardia pulmonis TaxID=2951408 RepID=A0A9X2IVL5_9NOCA|nr:MULTISPECIES: carboxylesterase family protein [Nocardia]MCM6772599.1 carboxylesterase family protein [Nocardia pulmonis]MCM6784743.1 carboxylesterase family protein [Nocardia sp. CDC159]
MSMGVVRPSRLAKQAVLLGILGLSAIMAVASMPMARPAPSSDALARTSSGMVRGTVAGTVSRFQGIPYAAPPLGPLRWQSPRPVGEWAGVRPATASGPRCAQEDPGKPGTLLAGSSEDCLYLDVTTPRGGGGRPVMVWIHGGGNTAGSGADYDPARMATRGDVVVVTINYRLGVFGFFGHPGLADSGTFALRDQQAALRWVRTNAAAFGGDPHNITVFGESAGGVDICAQLTSPGSAGLFDRAILQSGSCLTRVPTFAGLDGTVHMSTDDFWVPVSEDEAAGATLAAALQCTSPDTIGCMRGKSPSDVVGARWQTNAGFGPAYHTAALPLDPALASSRGQFHRVPVLSGYTRDEARLTTMLTELLAGQPFTPDSYHTVLRATFGSRTADAIAHQYPVPDNGDAGLAVATMDTDRVFACPQLTTIRALATQTPTYGYEFADPDAPTFIPYYSARPAGAAHTSELAYLFDLRNGGPYRGSEPAELTPAQRALGNAMIDIWTGFARTGRAPWVTYPTVQSLAPQGNSPADAWTTHRCDFWSTQQHGN